MEHLPSYGLDELPNEILVAIVDQLDITTLQCLIHVNKQLNALAQVFLKKKKIRFCGDNSRVLLLALPSKYDKVPEAHKFLEGFTYSAPITRATVVVKDLLEQRSLFEPVAPIAVKKSTTFFSGGKWRQLSTIKVPNKKCFRKILWINAVAADLLLYIVDPNEIDEHSSEIKELIFGSCFMMSARNVIIAVDLRHYQSNEATNTPTQLLHIFNETKAKMSTLLNETADLNYKFVPVNVLTGGNVTPELPKYEWFNGPNVRQMIQQDQLCTNFDAMLYQKLCDEPLKIQFMDRLKIGGIGTVLEGHVIRGVLEQHEDLTIHPAKFYGWTTGRVFSINTFNENCYKAKPGDLITFNINQVSWYDINQKIGYASHKDEDSKSTEINYNFTLAFRANLTVMNPDRFTQHQVYTVLYGTARIRCLLWWIVPEEGKNNNDKHNRKIKPPYDHVTMPKKPRRSQMDKDTYIIELQRYKREVSKLMTAHVKTNASSHVRQLKSTLQTANAILLPLDQLEIETYKVTVFEKNLCGKVMLVEKGSIVAAGRVNNLINHTTTFRKLTNKDYRDQYDKVIAQAAQLFNLPTEQKLLEMFLEHVNNDKHAKKCIQEQKGKALND